MPRLLHTNYFVYDSPAPDANAVFTTVAAKNFDVIDNTDVARRVITTQVDGGGTHISFASGATSSNKIHGPGSDVFGDLEVEGDAYLYNDLEVDGSPTFFSTIQAAAPNPSIRAVGTVGLYVTGLIRGTDGQTGTAGQNLTVNGPATGVIWA